MLDLVREHRQASYAAITDIMIQARSVGDVDLYKVSEFRGQMFALDSLIDTELFLQERLEGYNND